MLKMLFEIVRDILPIIGVIVFFQLLILRQPFPNLSGIVGGMVLVVIGLFLFTQGLRLGLFPLGESMAFQFAKRGNLWWLAILAVAAFGFGFWFFGRLKRVMADNV